MERRADNRNGNGDESSAHPSQAAILEICVDDPDGLRAAVAGGADRIELCAGLSVGGLTPSHAFAADAVASAIPVHALVRPRAGDFDYSDKEVALIVDDIAHLASLGIAGVVVGAADSSGRLHRAALGRFRDAAKEIAIVLHRVIDLTPDPVDAVCIAAALGFDFVLTSGGAPSAFEGRRTIAEMVAAAPGLQVIAGGGIAPEHAAALMRETDVTQIHASAGKAQGWRDSRIQEFGFAAGPQRVTDAERVAALKRAIGSV